MMATLIQVKVRKIVFLAIIDARNARILINVSSVMAKKELYLKQDSVNVKRVFMMMEMKIKTVLFVI
jgi:hypothetical protein